MRSLAPLLLCLALLVSTTGRAQAPTLPPLPESSDTEASPARAEPASPPGPGDTVSSPPLIPAAPEVDPEPRHTGPRLVDRELEAPSEYKQGIHLVIGTLLGTVGLLGGAFVGYGLGGNCDFLESSIDCDTGDAFLVIGGLTLGATLPVYGLGHLFDGRGSLLATLAGAMVGSAMSTLISVANIVGVFSYLLFPTVGAFTGFLLSHNGAVSGEVPAWQRFASQRAAPGVQVAFGPTRGGGFMGGLSGSF